MDFRKIGWICLMLFLTNQVFAQTDSTDINFYAAEPAMVTAEDSLILLSDTTLVELVVEFELTDTASNISKVWIELILIPDSGSPMLLSHNSYTLTQLEEAELMTDNDVLVSFGIYPNTWNFEVSIRFEDAGGNQLRVINKTFVP